MADIYVFLGPPGAGKGTLGDLFCADTGALHVSTGQLFRDETSRNSELGRQVKELMRNGELVSDEIVAAMVASRLAQEDIRKHGCLLDGFPRTTPQAEMLEKILAQTGHQMAAVLLIEADREMLITRLTSRRVCENPKCAAIYNVINLKSTQEGICDRCGGKLIQRADDSEETAVKRLKVYDQQTAPLIEFYRQKEKLVRMQSQDVSAQENYQSLKKALTAKG